MRIIAGSRLRKSPVKNLQAVNIYKTAIEISFNHVEDNLIEYYEIFVDGVSNNKTKNLQSFVLQLNGSTNYDISVKGVYISDNSYTGISNILNVTTVSSENLPYGKLTGYWKLDDNLKDSVSINNGYGINYSFANSLVNKGIIFDGSSTEITLSDNPYNLDIKNDSTVFFAMKGYDMSYKQTPFQIGDFGAFNEWGALPIFNNNRGFWFYYAYNSAKDYSIFKSNSHPTDNQDYIITLVRDYTNNKIKIYFDTTKINESGLVGSQAQLIQSESLQNDYKLLLGNGQNGGYFKGEISVFSTMKTALSDSKVTEAVNILKSGNHII